MTGDARFIGEGWLAWRLSSAVGRRRLRAIEREGLPASLAVPLGFLLDRVVDAADRLLVDRIEAVRARLASGAGEIGVFDAAAAAGRTVTATRADERQGRRQPLAEVARTTSVPAVWGMFLHLCARAGGARTILELGAGAGISGCYLGSAPTCRRFVTVEGSPERARLAEANLRAVLPRAEVHTASFAEALDALVPTFDEGLDLVFIDGNKIRGGYLDLADRVVPRLTRGALVVFDDIQWAEMREDWRALSERPGFSHAVNTGRFGVAVWAGGQVRPRAFTLYALAGVDLYRLRRDALRVVRHASCVTRSA